ncbi:TrmH family RNA methyltransferase [Flavilitoribacter nigricans]|uniref:tRNA (guanosine(18)-2'-O)-methyltransferase n=1 Tax=Flavilitoribacter nigricans (strain ATCC 23147 / DSM 23189 / NBRC 102662 / NCIMB 1420 / SS-2) TaxID=1122177 RepID=A0A2D0NH41_FLAN2|nr:RNA methyltransferase [Flavilitoribacter nigricans]PHN07489.1 RNA methyltransferase [Flavilitoribacter nigricans DSM 23189 = NBRC 102662]
MTPKRKAKFERTVAHRQFDLTVILENVHDHHNIGAVLRSCDSVGIHEIFVLYNEPQLQKEYLELGKRTTAGTRKWLDVHYYTDTEACFSAVRERYDHIYATHLSRSAKSLYDLDLTRRVALMFGNEMLGLSDEAMQHADGNFIIPQMGMAESLNISVACAVSLYEAYRQRELDGAYDPVDLEQPRRAALLEKYFALHESGSNRGKIRRKGSKK